jgi:hypothetical protein
MSQYNYGLKSVIPSVTFRSEKVWFLSRFRLAKMVSFASCGSEIMDMCVHMYVFLSRHMWGFV